MVVIKAAVQISPPSAQAAREVRRNSPIRQARTCYDHLAGVAGVELMDGLLRLGWLEETARAGGRTHYRLTPIGERALAERGADLSALNGTKRVYAYGCTDWTERRFHLGGALGAAALRALVARGILGRNPGARAVTLSEPVLTWLNGTE